LDSFLGLLDLFSGSGDEFSTYFSSEVLFLTLYIKVFDPALTAYFSSFSFLSFLGFLSFFALVLARLSELSALSYSSTTSEKSGATSSSPSGVNRGSS